MLPVFRTARRDSRFNYSQGSSNGGNRLVGTSRRSHRERGDLENEVLAALAAADGARHPGGGPARRARARGAGGPLPPGGVPARLDRELAYTTVMTTLTRLHAKDAVTRQRAGRASASALTEHATPARGAEG